MYFHPLILTGAQEQQRLAAYKEFARLWLDGIDRQHRLHTDAVAEFRARQQESLRALSEAIDIAHLVARYCARAARTPLELLEFSMLPGEIAVDVQHQVATLVDRHARELSGNLAKRGAGEGSLPKRDQAKSRRLQMA